MLEIFHFYAFFSLGMLFVMKSSPVWLRYGNFMEYWGSQATCHNILFPLLIFASMYCTFEPLIKFYVILNWFSTFHAFSVESIWCTWSMQLWFSTFLAHMVHPKRPILMNRTGQNFFFLKDGHDPFTVLLECFSWGSTVSGIIYNNDNLKTGHLATKSCIVLRIGSRGGGLYRC